MYIGVVDSDASMLLFSISRDLPKGFTILKVRGPVDGARGEQATVEEVEKAVEVPRVEVAAGQR